jgi:hypothetical protein
MEETLSSYGGQLPTKGGPPAWRLSVGLTSLHSKKNKLITNIQTRPRTWTDSFNKRPKRKKIDMRFGTCNVRSMYRYRAGSLRAVGKKFQSTS